MSFKRTVSFVLSFLLVFSVFFGGTGIFSSVAAEGTPPFVGSTKAMKTSSGIFIQSYITVEKGVSTEVGFYAAQTLDVYGFESTNGGEILTLKKSERETSMGAADLENYYTTWTLDAASVPYQAYEVDVTDISGSVTFGFEGITDNVDSNLVMQVYDPVASSYFEVSNQSYRNGVITLTYTTDAQKYAENGRVRYRITFTEGSTDKSIYMIAASAGKIDKTVQYGTTKKRTSSGNSSINYKDEATEDMYFMCEAVNENGVACSLPVKFLQEEADDQQSKLVQFNVNFAGDAKTTRNMSWHTAEDMATVVQVVPYGPLFPDFSNATEYVGTTVDYTEEYKDYVYNFAHYVTVDGLKPGGEYWYRYGNGEDVWSPPCYLRTDDGDGKFAFFFGGDPQPEASGASVEEEAEQHGKIYRQVALSWNEAVRLSGAEFFLNAGDETDAGRYERDWNWYYKSGIDIFRSQTLASTMGNHDFRYDSWADKWNFPYWLKKHNYVDPLGEYEHGWFYSFDYGNAHFSVINGNLADSNGSAHGVDFGDLRDKMITWLKADLAATDADFKIILSHQGMYSYPVHTWDGETKELRSLLVPIIDEYDVDIFFQGHDHVWIRTNTMEGGKKVVNFNTFTDIVDAKRETYFIDPNGTTYTNAGSITGSKYHNPDPTKFSSLISVACASQPELPTFTTVEIENGKLSLKGWVREAGGTCKRISEYTCYGDTKQDGLNILKTSFYDKLADRIDALPEDITLEDKNEVLALKAICDLESEGIIERYIPGYEKVVSAAATIEELERLANAVPEITVNGEIPSEWETGKPLDLPAATAYDENDGSVEVSVSVIGAESSVEVIDGKCTFVTPGSYTVKYSATDADGHTVEKEYAIEVILGTKKGDLDGDGEITVADALVALRIAARMAQATEQDMLIGDIDLDGEITVSDALAILRVAARMTDEL